MLKKVINIIEFLMEAEEADETRTAEEKANEIFFFDRMSGNMA